MRRIAFILATVYLTVAITPAANPSHANRFTVLDEFADIYYPNQNYPKLTTPQWIGEDGVEAVLVLAIDDMRDPKPYEAYLRPILERLKQIDGRAPVSIMSCKVDPKDPQLQSWLAEGLSLEAHTLDHPCPILGTTNFLAAKSTYDRCVDLFSEVPNSRPVGFRTPCMDGINSASPRLFAEIMLRTTERGNFLSISSSIGMVLTEDDPENAKEFVTDRSGKARFTKYLLPGYINYIKNYPYPWLVGNEFWETGFCLPDDYEASRVFGDKSAATVEDMKASIDAVVAKRGLWVLTFHPYQWIANTQIVELIEHTVARHGRKVKFMNLREVNAALERNLLAGEPIRARNGGENGVRLLDLNDDGYLDAVVANERTRKTRVWDPRERRWQSSAFPVPIARNGVRFGVIDNQPCAFHSNGTDSGFYVFDGNRWEAKPEFLKGLEFDGRPLATVVNGLDRGVRFRDFNGDTNCELIVSNPDQTAIFEWSPSDRLWKKLPLAWPEGVSLVTARGTDNGVRFVDFNKDGADDLIFSNEQGYGLWLNVPKLVLGFKQGWSRQIVRGKRGELPEIPMISRGGDFPNNGAWFANDTMWVQNEDTGKLPDLVARVSFRDLLNGFQPAPKSPQEALQSFVTDPDYIVELVAHEPAVLDPVAFDWSADGTLWVVQMRDYPRGIEGKAGGVLTRLRDEDGDGFYENWSVALEGLNYPNGVMPWRNGLLISAAPNILFAKDVNGDGKFEHTDVLFRGFVEGNQQHRANGFEYGLDNWLHGANGDSGGIIESLKTGASTPIAGRDFRFRPDSGQFEPTGSGTQFGKRRDDWGNWFGGANYTWGWHYWIPEHYLARNPSLAVRNTRRTLNAEGTSVFPISRVQQRFNDIGMAGHVTSACSFSPYRDELFGPEFEHSIFISEPTHNLVHREVLDPDGVSFRSHRAATEQGREFLASTDPWFRPTTIKTGPDGALYVADMYRLVIEHPEWIPQDAQDRMDLRAGSEKGRIYRVRPRNAPLRKPAALSTLNGAELARALNSPNGWQRDTVQRLLIQSPSPEALPVLRELAKSASSPKVRLQALCTLEGLQALSDELLAGALNDAHPAVREHGIRLSEPRLKNSPVLREKLLALLSDPHERVRFQLALSLGECPAEIAAPALLALLEIDAQHADLLTAIASSSFGLEHRLLPRILASDLNSPEVEHLINQLVHALAESKNTERADQALAALEQNANAPGWKLAAIAPLLRSTKARAELAAQARTILARDNAEDRDRLALIPLLANTETSRPLDLKILAALVRADNSVQLQHGAIMRLAQLSGDDATQVLLDRWAEATPEIRNTLLAVLLKREPSTTALLARLSSGAIAPDELGASGRQALLNHPSPAIRAKAEPLFKPALSDRDRLVASALSKVSGLPGDAARGHALFETNCALCHRAGEAGHGAGPNLAMLHDHSLEAILTAILDPNRAVEEKFRSHSVTLKNGDEFSGILLNESANSLTVMGITGQEQTILRREIASLKSSNRSLMPEGFEQFLKPQDLSDLVAFIRASR